MDRSSLAEARYRRLLVELRQLRRAADLRQADLAVRLHRPQSYVSKYESGERRLDVAELIDVCEALGASAAELVGSLQLAVEGDPKLASTLPSTAEVVPRS